VKKTASFLMLFVIFSHFFSHDSAFLRYFNFKKRKSFSDFSPKSIFSFYRYSFFITAASVRISDA